ncbi:MAG: aldehyde dehydrogenase family protein [Deltaproteobacteria bacterium]|nr:MAG: aldehyde dehydrogenase family protein [Deltaproteobacteria bacterium]
MHDPLATLGISAGHSGASDGRRWRSGGPPLVSLNPATGEPLGEIRAATAADADAAIAAADDRFAEWRLRPVPARGQLIARLGALLREHKQALGALISLEVGKIRSEGLGEVQEMIDICEFAVGLSRQLYGITLPSERPRHRMMEQWHPLGPAGVITAFNFPMAVWAWNAAIAAVCGDPVVWKPSPAAPLCAIAVQRLCERAMADHDAHGVFTLAAGGHDVGERLCDDARLPLVSFTGSIPVGRRVAERVARRLGRSLLELGGNNAAIVLDDARLDLAVRALAFGAVGTAGQRCTTTRRLFVQRGIAPQLVDALVAAYRSIRVGDPLDDGVLMGPLISADAVAAFERAVAAAVASGGRVLAGGRRIDRPGFYVEPTLIAAPPQDRFPIAHEETFAPILYVFEVDDLDEAIAANNAVRQGLSSCLFSESGRAAEQFWSAAGSDCGIANVNIGTSGAEIGGAFGGEKDTGGGREAGSDAWKAYMRRQTCTVNWGDDLPLAQGVQFL